MNDNREFYENDRPRLQFVTFSAGQKGPHRLKIFSEEPESVYTGLWCHLFLSLNLRLSVQSFLVEHVSIFGSEETIQEVSLLGPTSGCFPSLYGWRLSSPRMRGFWGEGFLLSLFKK